MSACKLNDPEISPLGLFIYNGIGTDVHFSADDGSTVLAAGTSYAYHYFPLPPPDSPNVSFPIQNIFDNNGQLVQMMYHKNDAYCIISHCVKQKLNLPQPEVYTPLSPFYLNRGIVGVSASTKLQRGRPWLNAAHC